MSTAVEQKEGARRCFCVCHFAHSSRAYCEHCKGDNSVTRFHIRRHHWYWRWLQNVDIFARDIRFILCNRRIPATWFKPKYKSPFGDR